MYGSEDLQRKLNLFIRNEYKIDWLNVNYVEIQFFVGLDILLWVYECNVKEIKVVLQLLTFKNWKKEFLTQSVKTTEEILTTFVLNSYYRIWCHNTFHFRQYLSAQMKRACLYFMVQLLPIVSSFRRHWVGSSNKSRDKRV